MRHLLSLCLAAVLFMPAFADKPEVSSKVAIDLKILEEIKDRHEVMTNLAYLSDVIGPRLTGSPSLERANNWAADKMKEYGLSNVRLEPYEIPLGWTRGTASLKMIEPLEKQFAVASGGWAPGTDGSVTGPVVVFEARTRRDLEKYKGQLKGAVLLRGKPATVAPVTDTRYGPGSSRGARPAETPPPKEDPPPPREPSPPAADDAQPPAEEKKVEPKEDQPPQRPGRGEFQSFQAEMTEFLKNEGVTAILIDSAKPHGLMVTTGGFRMTDDRVSARRPIPTLYVPHETYAMLYRLVTEQKVTPKVEVNVTNTFSDGPVTVYNTVGELPGSEKPDEYVILGAHIDSWDLASGTTDNGTGTSVVLEAARTLGALAKQGIRPKRTIRFVLFSGEEQGLHGSRAFVNRHKDIHDKISAAIVHDTGTGKVLALRTMGRTVIPPILNPELETLKQVGFEGAVPESSGGTDHLPFESAGIPGFPCKQETDEYRFTHHTQSDTFDKAKPANLIQGAQVLALAAFRIADLDELLPRDKPPARGRGASDTP